MERVIKGQAAIGFLAGLSGQSMDEAAAAKQQV